jgi:hypothetical protein
LDRLVIVIECVEKGDLVCIILYSKFLVKHILEIRR